MITTWMAGALARDLRALRRELEAYPDERDLWRTVPGIVNPAGTLALHLTGNLQHFIGTVLGGSSYVRNRDAEFNRRDVPRAELLREIDAALGVVEGTLSRLPDDALAKPFPQPIAGVTLATGDFLMHLCIHFGWHLGQLDYHRRLVTGQGGGGQIRAMLPVDLSSAKPQ
jgi:DinB family protein